MKVFVSYARSDKPIIVKLVTALQDAGVDVWWDRHLVPGTHFRDEIEAQLDSADKVVVAWTRESVKSTFVRDEANRALKQKKLVPISLATVSIPLGFGEIHAADCAESFDPLLRALSIPIPSNVSAVKSHRPIKPTKLERLILINQYTILSMLDPGQAGDHKQTLECLKRGYIDRLSFADWIEDDLDPTIHSDVLSILEMHRFLRFGYNQLPDKSKVDESKIEFRGFDGNYETSYLGYASYLLKTENLYVELHLDQGYNSHWPMLPRYIPMLRKWHELGHPREMNLSNILAIADVEDDASLYDGYVS